MNRWIEMDKAEVKRAWEKLIESLSLFTQPGLSLYRHLCRTTQVSTLLLHLCGATHTDTRQLRLQYTLYLFYQLNQCWSRGRPFIEDANLKGYGIKTLSRAEAWIAAGSDHERSQKHSKLPTITCDFRWWMTINTYSMRDRRR